MNDPPPGYDLALNQVALVACVQHLQNAKDALRAQRPQDALIEVQFAWSLLPNSVRAKFPESPTTMFKGRAASVPPVEQKKADGSPESLVGEIRDERARDRQLASQATALIFELSVAYITELAAQGLYVQRDRGTVEVTSRKKATEQPPTSGLPTTLPRSTS